MLSISVWDPPFVLPIHCDLRFEAFFNFPKAALHVFFSALPEDSVNYFITGLIILRLSMRWNTPWGQSLAFLCLYSEVI